LFRALEAACAAYTSLNLSLLHYITHHCADVPFNWSSLPLPNNKVELHCSLPARCSSRLTATGMLH